jgi:hypothetical protein
LDGIWTDAQGFEHVLQDVNGKQTLGPALAPFIIPDPNVDIKLIIVPFGCPGKEYHFSLKSLLGDPGDVYVTGDYTNYLNSTKTFNMSGSCLVNPFNQYTWNNPSVGNIVSGGNTSSVQINFTMKTCGNGYYGGCFPAYIIGNSKNPCFTQRTSSGSWKVEVR